MRKGGKSVIQKEKDDIRASFFLPFFLKAITKMSLWTQSKQQILIKSGGSSKPVTESKDIISNPL